jgi:hypothetical protein
VTAPQDVADVYKNVATLNWDGHLNQILTNFGFKGDALKLAWHKPLDGDSCYVHKNPVNPKQLSLIHLIEEVYIAQLLPGIHMDEMCKAFISSLHDGLQPTKLDFCTLERTTSTRRVSLKALCRSTLVEAATRSMFGDVLHHLCPNIAENMLQFNDRAWMVFFGLPEFLSPAVANARRTMTETMKAFVALPEQERAGQAWGIGQILKAQEIVGIDIESRACMLLLIYWA